ncbi:MAG: hypothetical protein H6934_13860 [Burkholderiaceae bacterium]|nr:hypothetical protein [Burkholderiaceae bacterium]
MTADGIRGAIRAGLIGVLACAPVIGAAASVSWEADPNSSKAKRTRVSGVHSTSSHPFWIDRRGFIYGIEWSERNDKPCFLKIYTARLRGSKPSAQYGTEYDYEFRAKTFEMGGGCALNASSLRKLHYQIPRAPGWKTNGLPKFINAVKVCGNDKRSSNDERVKGITAYAVQVSPDGRFQNVGAELTERRTNCKKWYTKTACPAGTAAYGVQVVGDLWLKGLQLECAPLKGH